MGYRQVPLWLSQEEVAEHIGEVGSRIVSRLNNAPAPNRSLYLLSPIPFPLEALPP